MSELHNSESTLRELLEARTLEARDLARQRDRARTPDDREVLTRQLRETEQQIHSLQRRLRSLGASRRGGD